MNGVLDWTCVDEPQNNFVQVIMIINEERRGLMYNLLVYIHDRPEASGY